MKKVILITLLAAFSMATFAQQHLTFKGVPINGTLKEYTEAMKAKGFTYIGEEDGISALQGDFAGYKNCTIAVYTLQNFDMVSTIAVFFPKVENWTSLMQDYNALKEALTGKYGQPSEVQEHFNTYAGSDGLKMLALEGNELEWYTVFSTELGDIKLTIIGESSSEAMVALRYRDKINGEKARQNAIDDL